MTDPRRERREDGHELRVLAGDFDQLRVRLAAAGDGPNNTCSISEPSPPTEHLPQNVAIFSLWPGPLG